MVVIWVKHVGGQRVEQSIAKTLALWMKMLDLEKAVHDAAHLVASGEQERFHRTADEVLKTTSFFKTNRSESVDARPAVDDVLSDECVQISFGAVVKKNEHGDLVNQDRNFYFDVRWNTFHVVN